jgi:hypothetical protein
MKAAKTQVVLILLAILVTIAGAQLPTNHTGTLQETLAPKYWIDPATGLMWARKDNGRDVNWHKATKYCHDLRVTGYSNWRLPTISELQGIYDRGAEARGRDGQGASTWNVKGSLFLTGLQWSSTQREDSLGRPDGFAWYFDFANGRRNDEDASRFSGRLADYGKRALCVRRPEE